MVNIKKYERLLKRRQEIKNDNNKDEESYCIDHFFECETAKTYESILDVAKNKGYNRVFDIGCAYGHQSEVFFNSEIDYVGIDEYQVDFWNIDKYKYIKGKYPFKISTRDKDIAISVLCLTWNCYLYEKEKTLKDQLEQLSNDFQSAILYLAKDKVDFVKEYFPMAEKIDENLFYFAKLSCSKKEI